MTTEELKSIDPKKNPQKKAVLNFLKSEEVVRLREDNKLIGECFQLLNDVDGWTKHLDTDERKIYYRQEDDLSNITVYWEFFIDAPIINVGCFLAEYDLYKEWAPMTPVSEVLKEVSPLRKLATLK